MPQIRVAQIYNQGALPCRYCLMLVSLTQGWSGKSTHSATHPSTLSQVMPSAGIISVILVWSLRSVVKYTPGEQCWSTKKNEPSVITSPRELYRRRCSRSDISCSAGTSSGVSPSSARQNIMHGEPKGITPSILERGIGLGNELSNCSGRSSLNVLVRASASANWLNVFFVQLMFMQFSMYFSISYFSNLPAKALRLVWLQYTSKKPRLGGGSFSGILSIRFFWGLTHPSTQKTQISSSQSWRTPSSISRSFLDLQISKAESTTATKMGFQFSARLQCSSVNSWTPTSMAFLTTFESSSSVSATSGKWNSEFLVYRIQARALYSSTMNQSGYSRLRLRMVLGCVNTTNCVQELSPESAMPCMTSSSPLVRLTVAMRTRLCGRCSFTNRKLASSSEVHSSWRSPTGSLSILSHRLTPLQVMSPRYLTSLPLTKATRQGNLTTLYLRCSLGLRDSSHLQVGSPASASRRRIRTSYGSLWQQLTQVCRLNRIAQSVPGSEEELLSETYSADGVLKYAEVEEVAGQTRQLGRHHASTGSSSKTPQLAIAPQNIGYIISMAQSMLGLHKMLVGRAASLGGGVAAPCPGSPILGPLVLGLDSAGYVRGGGLLTIRSLVGGLLGGILGKQLEVVEEGHCRHPPQLHDNVCDLLLSVLPSDEPLQAELDMSVLMGIDEVIPVGIYGVEGLDDHVLAPRPPPEVVPELVQRLREQDLQPDEKADLPPDPAADGAVAVHRQLVGLVAVQQPQHVEQVYLVVGLHPEDLVDVLQGLALSRVLLRVDVEVDRGRGGLLRGALRLHVSVQRVRAEVLPQQALPQLQHFAVYVHPQPEEFVEVHYYYKRAARFEFVAVYHNIVLGIFSE